MHGDFSRRTFDSADGYRAVLLQQGRVLLDADWNEQADITAHHDETRTADIVGRSGGPVPEPGATGVAALGPFAISAADGSTPNATAWADLRVTPGRYYVHGVLCESGPVDDVGWPLTDQPHLPAIGRGAGASPGLPEPTGAQDRYALYLDVWTRHVTAQEDPALREVALGGPDTTTRAQTVWQVRAEPLADTTTCSALHDPEWLRRTPRPMAAGLQAPGSTADPCQITTTGGYQRLENQLYRIEIHNDGADGTPATFLWSRDNGSVIAGLTAIDVVGGSTTGATLTLDRIGRDEESSFAAGHLVEITSTDTQLRGQRGFLARAGTPTVVSDSAGTASAITLPVTWLDPANRPTTLAALGRTPIVRRWDGDPGQVRVGAVEVEAGITVRFPNTGELATGDHWLIPARSVRMAYGVSQLGGTIEWPPGGRGPVEQPPVGPLHQVAPLAVVERDGTGWSLVSDCRTLFPPLTAMVTIDLLGGDGQEAMPGDPLPRPVRVVVRNGGLPVVGAPVAFRTGGGHLADTGLPTSASPADLPDAGHPAVRTGPDGVADVRWLLDSGGAATQTLTVQRLDDHGDPIDAAVVVTGRLSVARQVAWSPPDGCERFAGTRTVQDALIGLVGKPQLRLLGGDGQEVGNAGSCVPQSVRVILDSPCGPIAGEQVLAVAGSPSVGFGLVAPADPAQPTPPTLSGSGAGENTVTATDAEGVAAFWWQPDFGNGRSATLDVFFESNRDAPIRVTASLDPPGGRRPGIHITDLRFRSGKPFRNDTQVHPEELASGIIVELDGPLQPESLNGKPVARVVLDLPWPIAGDGEPWSDRPIGYRSVELAADLKGDANRFFWQPRTEASNWILDRLWGVLRNSDWGEPILCRFLVDGWAIVSADDPDHHLNGHAIARMRRRSTDLELPTDDEVAGGQFSQWFWLTPEPDTQGRIEIPDVAGRTLAVAQRLLAEVGLTVGPAAAEPSDLVRKGLVLRTDPPAGTEVPADVPVTVIVSGGRV